MFTGGAPVLESKSFDSVKVCVIDLVVSRDVARAQTCVTNAAVGMTSEALLPQLQSYLASSSSEFLGILDKLLFPKTSNELSIAKVQDKASRVSRKIASWVVQESSFEGALYSLFGMARAQTLEPEPSPTADPYAWLKTTAGLGFAIVTVTAFVRKYLLKSIDGVWVSVLAIGVGLVIYYVLPLIPSALFNEVAKVILTALSGSGTVILGDRYLKKDVKAKLKESALQAVS